jgi:HEPN domain-containing protein
MSDIRIIQEWLKYSQSDMIAARYMFYNVNPKQTEISVCHCQQCAEKALKAYLVAHELDPPKIHDLLILKRANCALKAPAALFVLRV